MKNDEVILYDPEVERDRVIGSIISTIPIIPESYPNSLKI